MSPKSSAILADTLNWLDLETRAQLLPAPPEDAIATAMQSYSLLLLKFGSERLRTAEVVREFQRSVGWRNEDLPFVIARGLTVADALVGQLALACCDCITAFVADEHIRDDNTLFLQRLLLEVSASPEFESVPVRLDVIPDTEASKRFCWQFLGNALGCKLPATFEFYRKKVRLMKHWAGRVGVRMEVDV